jgi:hypothetical protein
MDIFPLMSDFADLTSFVAAGAVAGNMTVTGIVVGDIIRIVQDLTTGDNLATEFTVTAADTINNTGGTSTNGHAVLVIWQRRYGSGRHKFEAGSAVHGRSPY